MTQIVEKYSMFKDRKINVKMSKTCPKQSTDLK